jgi:low affinity Fe/Cu permease
MEGPIANKASTPKHRPFRRRPRWTERFARVVTSWTGSTIAFLLALVLVVVWLITGPIFQFSDTWQLVINTGTTIVTFLMVFLIQRAQNKDAQAMQLKLNEIIAALNGASSRLLNLEDFSESELQILHRHYAELAHLARQEHDLTKSHSVEEATRRHQAKQRS